MVLSADLQKQWDLMYPNTRGATKIWVFLLYVHLLTIISQLEGSHNVWENISSCVVLWVLFNTIYNFLKKDNLFMKISFYKYKYSEHTQY